MYLILWCIVFLSVPVVAEEESMVNLPSIIAQNRRRDDGYESLRFDRVFV